MELENFSRKLQSIYSNNPSKEPTPCQAKRIMNKNSFIIGLSELTGIEKLDELEKAFIKKGKPLTYNAENFIESLEEFKKNDEEALLKIKCFDEKCVRKKTGKIITRRLTKLFNNSIILFFTKRIAFGRPLPGPTLYPSDQRAVDPPL